jgi:peroxiredoxin
MKWLIATLLCGAFVTALGQSGSSAYRITGSFSKLKTGDICLTLYDYDGDKPRRDTATLQNGQFLFTGTFAVPQRAVLSISGNNNDWLEFYVEPGAAIRLSGTGQRMKALRITGSPLTDDYKRLQSLLQPMDDWSDENNELLMEALKKKDVKKMDSLMAQIDSAADKKKRIAVDFIKSRPQSLRSAMAIEEYFAYYAEASDVEPLYNLLSTGVKNSVPGQRVKKMLDVYKKLAPGQPAPDISQPMPDNNIITLSSLRGQYVLVDFWASWCGPCRKENPHLVKAYRQYKDKGFTILGVSYDSRKENWVKAIQQDSLTWPQVSDLKGWENASAQPYYIKAIPSNVLVDKEGRIVARNLFDKELYAKLAEVLE